MTRAAKIVPMPFEDFAPRATISPHPAPAEDQPPAPPETRFTQAEMDAAVAAARREGRDEAADAASAATAAQLARLSDALARETSLRSEALEADRRSLRDALRAFLQPLCRRLAAENAEPLALSLVERVLAASAEKTPATLFVSQRTFASLGDRLQTAAARAGVEVGSDAALEDGECRLQWRGGAASYSHDAVTAEIDRVLAADAAEASGERP